MTNKGMPKDGNGESIQLIPLTTESVVTEITALTTHALTSGKGFLELYNPNEDMVLKWGADTITANNYNVIIPTGQIRNLVVPSGVTNIMLAKLADVTAVTEAFLIES